MNPIEVYRALKFAASISPVNEICLECNHGLYYHRLDKIAGACRHNATPESKIRTMTNRHDQAIIQKVWREAAQYVDSKPCLGEACRGKWYRFKPNADPRRHNMRCPKFIAYVFRANADRENYQLPVL